VIARRDLLEQSQGNSHSLAMDLYDQWTYMQKTTQWRFTPPTHVVAAFRAALDQFKAEGGTPARGNRYRKNCDTLVDAMSERSREFALLQLVGSRTRQVRAMMRIESLMVVGIAVVVGSLIALPPLMGIAVAVSGQPVPAISPAIYGSIVAVTAVLGFVSIAIPTRAALRKNPMDGVRNH